MKRRDFLAVLGLAGVATVAPSVVQARPKLNLSPAAGLERLDLSDEEWRERLTPEQYEVMRDAGTEPSGSSPLNAEKRDGEYRCAACDLALFTSAMKYDSGTGWPSFFDHVEGHLLTETDYKLIWPRTEYHCARCGSHQGHVFEDGPDPTGLRWCNNGVALKFVPA
ncbi:peptide-methionine (R)-S-oxide reductase MsrB [Halomonas binhaiensis]|uniref:peptide-methionine (R)-S-oxide reductase n=1 Tax=Halomonas binhaiensis TaxID=2562282 RepID=A0A5C1NBX7_9GAMM|nr:peptide-methionine (R)-S-oxide reductase MsrB [Halomonas binhaiensis]QEM80866.1 peptide-methionine (R)-S-oxide reductase MsrB [Halomonas binhaiensis]